MSHSAPRYELRSLLGEGGIGQVYAGYDTVLGRMVAIKVLRREFNTDHSFVERFRAEAASLAPLNHPNISTLYDLVEQNGQLLMVMELVSGHTLEWVLSDKRRLGLRECQAIIAQASAGLSYAHGKHVIHRDIKPANMMLTDSGVLKIMDFGIARVRGAQRMTRVGSLVGTLAYVAPEQVKGEPGDEHSDLYSLACVLYEMLSGHPPFRSDSEYDLMRAQVEAMPQPLRERIPDVDAATESVLLRALAKAPGGRYASVAEFAQALGADAIQGEAARIIHDNVLSTLGTRPVLATRFVELRPQPATPGGQNAAKSAPPRQQDRSRFAAGVAQTVVANKKLGFAALAGGISVAAFAAFLTGGDVGTPPARSASETTPTRLASIPAPSANLSAKPMPGVPQSSMMMPAPGRPPPTLLLSDTIKGSVSSFTSEGWPVIAGQVIRLAGVQGMATDQARSLESWVSQHGGTLDCKPVGAAGFQCQTQDGIDVSEAILFNGGAKAATDATQAYREAEQQARDARRGLWQQR